MKRKPRGSEDIEHLPNREIVRFLMEADMKLGFFSVDYDRAIDFMGFLESLNMMWVQLADNNEYVPVIGEDDMAKIIAWLMSEGEHHIGFSNPLDSGENVPVNKVQTFGTDFFLP